MYICWDFLSINSLMNWSIEYSIVCDTYLLSQLLLKGTAWGYVEYSPRHTITSDNSNNWDIGVTSYIWVTRQRIYGTVIKYRYCIYLKVSTDCGDWLKTSLKWQYSQLFHRQWVDYLVLEHSHWTFCRQSLTQGDSRPTDQHIHIYVILKTSSESMKLVIKAMELGTSLHIYGGEFWVILWILFLL